MCLVWWSAVASSIAAYAHLSIVCRESMQVKSAHNIELCLHGHEPSFSHQVANHMETAVCAYMYACRFSSDITGKCVWGGTLHSQIDLPIKFHRSEMMTQHACKKQICTLCSEDPFRLQRKAKLMHTENASL